MLNPQISAPDFERLSDMLRSFGALQSAGELHGFLVGQLAAGRRFSRSEWLRSANEQADLSRNPDEVAGDLLFSLYEHTLASLQDNELDFQPLLPADETPLLQRAEALGHWCQGFLLGFGLAGNTSTNDAELAESLRDLAAVAQVGADDDTESDSGESDLFSICEYVRLTAIDIFWQHYPDAPPGRPAATATTSPANLFRRDKLH